MTAAETIILYIILGAIIGIIWSLRKIYTLEWKIDMLLEHVKKKKK